MVSKERLQTASHILLACLAGIDLFWGLVALPIAISIQMKKILGKGPFCNLEKVFTVLFTALGFASVGQLVLVSTDRYIAIKHPLRYQHIVSRKTVKYGLLLNLFVSAVVTVQKIVLAALDSGTKRYLTYGRVRELVLVFVGVICLGVICYTYRYIFSETRRQMKQLKTEQLTNEEAKRLKKNNKAATTLAILLVVLALSYLPSLIVFFVLAVSEDILEPPCLMIVWIWIESFSALSCLFHPIVYCWRSKQLRKTFLEILHLRQPENIPPPVEMQVLRIKRHRCQVPPTDHK